MDFDPVAYINNPAWHSSIYGLERIEELLEALGSPHKKLKFVHVAGTNGKGSVCAYLDSILRQAGYKTGLFTSPYIETFEERIRVDGENIPMERLAEVTLAVRDVAEAMEQHPTEFELMCAVALVYFAESGCDICVLEVGLGGRMDSTNIIPAPECCVIARIGLDHTELLGETTAKIAAEKAAIIKPGTTVVSWPQDADAMEVVRAAADATAAPLVVADLDQLEVGGIGGVGGCSVPRRAFAYKGAEYATGLLASYQPANAAVAIECAWQLRQRGWDISDSAIELGVKLAQWPGRFEVLLGSPTVIIDGGHNPQGASVLAESLRSVFPDTKPVFVVGILGDKDYGGMIAEVLELGQAFVCVTPPNPRALPAEELGAAIYALDNDANVQIADSFEDAWQRALELAGEAGVVCAFGSLYSIHDLKQALAKTRS